VYCDNLALSLRYLSPYRDILTPTPLPPTLCATKPSCIRPISYHQRNHIVWSATPSQSHKGRNVSASRIDLSSTTRNRIRKALFLTGPSTILISANGQLDLPVAIVGTFLDDGPFRAALGPSHNAHQFDSMTLRCHSHTAEQSVYKWVPLLQSLHSNAFLSRLLSFSLCFSFTSLGLFDSPSKLDDLSAR